MLHAKGPERLGPMTGLPDAVRRSILPSILYAGLSSSEYCPLPSQLPNSLSGRMVFVAVLTSEKCLVRRLAQFKNISFALKMPFLCFTHYAISTDAYSFM